MLAILVIVTIAGVAFIHYTWGLFGATLSAICVVVAAMLALGWQEWVVTTLLAGKFADSANGLVTVGLFAMIYLVLRVLLDQLVPGNVRFPLLLDKIGAGVMGVIAGIFATGIFVIALQMMPFGRSVIGYERFPSEEKKVMMKFPGQTQMVERTFSELKTEQWNNPSGAVAMMLPVDDWVLGFFKYCNVGALSGETSFLQIHPDYLKELFGQRLGVENGVKHVALKDTVRVGGVFTTAKFINFLDSEMTGVRADQYRALAKPEPNKPITAEQVVAAMSKMDPSSDKTLRWLVVRADIDAGNNLINAESDKLFRFGPASVRVVIKGEDYFCKGTLATNLRYIKSQPDDYILVEGKTVDLVFEVPDVFAVDVKKKEARMPADSFLEVKRLGRADLSNLVVSNKEPPALTGTQVLYKKDLPVEVGMKRTPVTRPATGPEITVDITKPQKVESLLGVWTAPNELRNISTTESGKTPYRIELLADKTYTMSVRGESTKGTWELKESMLRLIPTDKPDIWRRIVVSVDGQHLVDDNGQQIVYDRAP